MMRREVLFLLVAVMFSLSAMSQEYRPLLSDGKSWVEYRGEPVYEYNYESYLSGDTVINGKKYFKLYRRGFSRQYDSNGWYTAAAWNGDYATALREEDRRVYNSSGRLLYDFNLAVGDVVELEKNKVTTVIAIDSVWVGTHRYRRLRVNERDVSYGPNNTGVEGDWIEGIGSTAGLLRSSGWTTLGNGGTLVECYEDGERIYSVDDYRAGGTAPTPRYGIEGRTWRYMYVGKEAVSGCCAMDDRDADLLMTVRGDTITTGFRAKKMYACSARIYGDTQWHYAFALREEQPDVFVVPDEWSGKRPLMTLAYLSSKNIVAFSTTTGKSGSWVVKGHDNLTSQGVFYTMITFTDGTSWIEGIGHSDCGLRLTAPNEARDSLSRYILTSCYDGDRCIYRRKDYQAFTDIKNYSASQVSAACPIADLQGRRLTTPPRRGLYIRDGRKYVAR